MTILFFFAYRHPFCYTLVSSFFISAGGFLCLDCKGVGKDVPMYDVSMYDVCRY